MREMTRSSPWWPPAPDSPLRAFSGRVLTHLNTLGSNRFATLASTVDQSNGGLILTGRQAPQRIAELRRHGFTAPLVIDAAAYGHAYARFDAPFDHDEGLYPVTLTEHLDRQREAGADIALTPTLLIGRDDIGSVVSVLNATARLARDDTVAVLPLTADWFRPTAYPLLRQALKDIPVPTALVLAADRDPLDAPSAPERLRRLLDETPGLCLLRTDLAAFEAVTRGAGFASIGVTASLRHAWIPEADPKKRRGPPQPSVYVPELFRWIRADKLHAMFANTAAPPCRCPVCHGRRYDTYTSRTDGQAAERHAIACWNTLLTELRDTVQPAYRKAWWYNKCRDAVGGYRRWSSRWRSTSELKIPAALRFWATSSP